MKEGDPLTLKIYFKISEKLSFSFKFDQKSWKNWKARASLAKITGSGAWLWPHRAGSGAGLKPLLNGISSDARLKPLTIGSDAGL